MKKLFFFKSSSSSSGNNNGVLSASTDKQVYRGNMSESWLNDHLGDMVDYSWKPISDSPSFGDSSCLVRSRSVSSATFVVDELGRENCSSSQQQYDHRSRAHIPDQRSKKKRWEANMTGSERPCSSDSSRLHHDSSGGSSSCSSNVSSQVIDRFIDGEQLLEISQSRNRSNPGNGGRRRPPQVRYTAPSSPTHSVKEKNKFHSFRDGKGTSLRFSSRDRLENGFRHESPRMVAKNVIERLSQTHVAPRSSSKGVDNRKPITNDVYGGYMDIYPESKLETDEPYKRNFIGGNSDGLNSSEEDSDVELRRRSKEAGERVSLLSEANEKESFLCNGGFDVSSLVRSVQLLKEEKAKLALEVSGLVQSRIAERASAREELRMARAEMESQIEKLAKEKHEMQLGFEKEFDRRSSDWSIKLEKFRIEEKRLRGRVQELAEQNVSLQRDVSSFNDKETENQSLTKYSEQQLKELTRRIKELTDENRDLSRNLSESQEKHRAAIEDVACNRRNLEEKVMECKELQKSVTRLLRTCSEQEKTIEGLRDGFSKEIEEMQSMEKNEKQVKKLLMEQMRLTGVELALRKEVESYRLEAYSLRHENIDLLNRLKFNGNDIIRLTFKLDNELRGRVCCLQNQGLSMLNKSIDVSSKLMEFIKGKSNHLQETQPGLDSQFIVESDLKIKGFKHGVESLTRSLQTISGVLHEKSNSVVLDSHSASIDPTVSTKLNNQSLEEIIRSELKAETLVTSLLKEKLYSKEVEIEQLQAELAAALRGNELLRCEVQSSMDNISCLTHRLKELQLQIPKKDENVSLLECDLQESMNELTILKGVLVNVSQERDLMWEEVKQYNEKNMDLNLEINELKKRIQGLDEDVLLKEGQITILKDSLSNYKTFDLLGSPDSMPEFLLK